MNDMVDKTGKMTEDKERVRKNYETLIVVIVESYS